MRRWKVPSLPSPHLVHSQALLRLHAKGCKCSHTHDQAMPESIIGSTSAVVHASSAGMLAGRWSSSRMFLCMRSC